MYLFKSMMTPTKIKSLLRKIFSQLISYTEYTEHVRFYLPLPPASVTVSIFTVSAYIFLILTLNIPIVFTVVPYYIISPIHSIGHTALLKPFVVTSAKMCCHAVVTHI